jgi:hypothetical protein
MKHIRQYTRNGKPVSAHIRNGKPVTHDIYGDGQVLQSELDNEEKMVWFYNRQRGLIRVGKSALSL